MGEWWYTQQMRILEEVEKLNSFQAICDIATEEQWCWHLGCGTCGHLNFVKSLLLLIDEKEPYPTHVRDYKKLLFSRADKLQEKVKDIDIDYFAKSYKSPRFLAYLGLCIHYAKEKEEDNRILTESWTPQLIKLIQNEKLKDYLQKILNDKRALNIKDLENIEMCFPIQHDRYRG